MLSESLRLMRVFHDWNQQELAERLKISRSYLSEIESGKKTPTLEILEKYADVFSIPLSSILFFSEQMSDKEGTKEVSVRNAISKKILRFLALIEERTREKESR